MMRQFASQEFIRFLVTGGIAALVNFFSRIVLNLWLSFSTSIILAYLIGMVTAFSLVKFFVFTSSTQSLASSAGRFVAVNVVAIAQTWLVSMAFDRYLLPWIGITQFSHEIAHAIGIGVPVFTSYLGHKHWSFR